METIKVTCTCGHPTNVPKKTLEKYGADNPAAIICKDDGHKMKYVGTEIGECLSGKTQHQTAPKAETPKTEAPKAETPKTEVPKAETPKTEAPKAKAQKTGAKKGAIPQAKSSNWFTRWISGEDKKCTDGHNDGKISFGEKMEFLGKGLFSMVKNIINNPLTSIGIAAGATILGFLAPVTIPVMLWGGLGLGVAQLGFGSYKAATAKTDTEAKNGWEGIGAGLFAVGASTFGLVKHNASKVKLAEAKANLPKAKAEYAKAEQHAKTVDYEDFTARAQADGNLVLKGAAYDKTKAIVDANKRTSLGVIPSIVDTATKAAALAQ